MALDLLAARVDFAHLLSQHARLLQLHTHTAPDAAAPDTAALVPQTLHVREGVNELFRIEVEAVSTSAHLTLETFIGTPVTVGLMRADGRYRHWHGYATSAQSLGADGGLARYRLRKLSSQLSREVVKLSRYFVGLGCLGLRVVWVEVNGVDEGPVTGVR